LVYNQALRDQARSEGRLASALGPEIGKAWELYKSKVSPEVVANTTYFKDALNEVLAGARKSSRECNSKPVSSPGHCLARIRAALGEQRAALSLADASAFLSARRTTRASWSSSTTPRDSTVGGAPCARSRIGPAFVACRTCDEETWRRWMVLGCKNVLRAPFGKSISRPVAGERRSATCSAATRPRGARQDDVRQRPRVRTSRESSTWCRCWRWSSVSRPAISMNLPLAIDEAVSNAIIHGNKRDVRKRVEVEGQIDAATLRVGARRGRGCPSSPIRPPRELAGVERPRPLPHRIGMDEVRHRKTGAASRWSRSAP
jgi:hypothetical protein